TTTYTINNNHATENLTINSITLGFGVTEFQMGTISETLPFDVTPGGNITFDVDFSPLATGNYQTSVNIDNSENGQNPFQYTIAGQGADVVVSGDIMITQYYEGTGNNKWVEIKNISGANILAGTFFLALYNDTDIPNITINPPTASVAIPAMAINEVLLFRNGGTLLPTSGNLGLATQIDATAVCSFVGGDDVIIISSTNDASSYANREDIIGDVPGAVWGGVFSFIRGGAYELPEADFHKLHWIELSVGGDVDAANPNTNIALGTQDTGLANWTGSWSNGIDPDRTRNVEITTDYNAADGTFVAGNLIVNANLNLNGGTTNSVIVYNDLTINGTFTIGDQESLVIYGSGTITGNITKLENSTNRADQYDVTYWSSPIVSANLGTVFSGVDPNRIYLYNQDNTNTIDPLDPTYYDVWEIASGTMVNAKGYAADGPTGTTGVHSISFTGVPNSGTVSIELSNLWLVDGEPDNDYNLIGNPYPSAIDSDIFLNGNGNIGGTVYLWTHTTPLAGGDYEPNDYATLNIGGGTAPGGGTVLPRIGSSQGFMVASISAGLVSFTSSMQIPDANDQFYKSNSKKDIVEKDRIWLDIATDQGGRNQQLIVFNEKATNGIDHGYDSKGIWGVNTIDFYSDINDENYVIQGLPPFSTDQTIQLGFDTKVAPRTMTISINRMEGILKSTEIYLVDNFLNVTHDLRAGDYAFEQATTGAFAKRFTLKFAGQTLDVDDIVLDGKQFIVSNNFGNIKIRANKNVKAIKVYDLFGRMLISKNPNLQSFELNTGSIRNGTVLIIEATLENGSVISRKTIKYQ
ncbi:hypothetical protein JYU17_00295, partial [Flavobacteriaceae bacterium AH-315-O20]|nr:hypothetical protein [Flavobacteriaceae bacterium AH-315-O20]